MESYWDELERPGPDSVPSAAGELRAGSRVRLQPRPGGDVFDIALAGRAATIDAIEQDLEGNVTLAVVVDDDPGRDLGFARQPGHRFFFSPSEVELLDPGGAEPGVASPQVRVLVAGVGNVFLGDDGFGVALADRLAPRRFGAGIDVVDFGIRGLELAHAMLDGYDAVLLLDATPRGEAPGTLYVIEADLDPHAAPALNPHGMDPVAVIGLVRALGGRPPRTLVVGCEPQTQMSIEAEDLVARLSEPVSRALDPAVKLVESLLEQITNHEEVSAS